MKILKKIIKWIPFFGLYVPFKTFSFLNKGKKDILLFGTGTGLYHDNAKYLYEFYIKENISYKLYWIADNKNVYRELKKKNRNVVKKKSLKAAYLASRAKSYFITAEIFDVFYFVNSKTSIIQLWHGTPIKKIGYDTNLYSDKILKKKYFGFNYTYQRFDSFIIEDVSFKEIFQSAFRLDKEKILPLGQIRNSILLDSCQERINILKKSLKLEKVNKILMYVPTFRDNFKMNTILLEKLLNHNTRKWLEANDVILLIKLHPLLVNGQLGLYRGLEERLRHKNIVDLSYYEDIQELLLISDILITDYSSVVFDFAILQRPIYLLQPDLEEYEKLREGFYFTYGQLLKIAKRIKTIEDIDLKIQTHCSDYSYKIDYEGFLKLI